MSGQSPRIINFGCRLNIQEGEAMASLAGDQPDVVVVNTCAVTSEATRQARQAIRRIGRERPQARILVTGCAAQIEPARFAEMPQVSRVIGNHEKMQPETWERLRRSNSFGADASLASDGKVEVGDIMAVRATGAPAVNRFRAHTRAFVQVQNGCDHRCTFCVIPFGRGNSRSLPSASVVDQVAGLVETGVKEVVLTGVDLTSYGKDLPGFPTLGGLVKSILGQVPDLPRLRLSSIDAVEVDEELKEAFATEARLMPHLHLSLQSGDDLILKRMKRRHTREDAVSFCDDMRRLRPDIVFGADLIAGFPTEDEAMFARTLEIVEACGIVYLHAFPYSARPDTPAARMPQLPGGLIAERAARLRARGAAALARHEAAQIGRRRMILTERGNVGRAEDFTLIAFPGGAEAGELREARIAMDAGRLVAA